VGRAGTPSGQACTAPSGKSLNTGATKCTTAHFSSAASVTTLKPKRTGTSRAYVVLSIATKDSWKNDQGEYENRTERHRVYAWRNLSRIAKTLQKSQLITVDGQIRKAASILFVFSGQHD